MKRKIVLIIGPTAVGKTKFAISVAQNLNGEIISADSMQIYKYMDIGSAKPSAEELKEASHHLIDFIDPFENFSVAEYQRAARSSIEDILSRGKLPIVSGGTGLYINSIIYDMDFSETKEDPELRERLQEIAATKGGNALHEILKNVDPVAAGRIHPNNIKKLIRAIEVAETTGKGISSFDKSFVKAANYQPIIIGLRQEREFLYNRIDKRVDLMIEAGLMNEVEDLMGKGLSPEHNSMKGIGYKELIEYFIGEIGLDEAISKIKQNSRNYAKRQMTWFRRYDDIRWFDIEPGEDFDLKVLRIVEYIKDKLAEKIE